MKAVILAGGEGTRLRPLTCDLPKPLVPICGKPVLFYILELLEKNGCTEAAVAVRYRGERIEAALGDGRYGGLRTFVSYEDKPLGTAGCVKKAAADFDDDFIVISGDAMCDFDLAAMYRHHKDSGTAATIAVRSVDDPREYGVIIGENGMVTGFSEKPSYINCRSDLANTGIYVISPKVLGLIADDKPVDFAKDVFPEMLGREMPLGYFADNGYWCDIGDIGAYRRCTFDLIGGKIRAEPAERIVTRNSHISRTSFIAKGAYFSPKALAAGCTSVGAGAYISDGAKLSNAIVMDGVFVGEDVTLNDCIVCSNARIGSGASVYESAVVGEGAVGGENAVVNGGVRIWTNKRIDKNATVTSDVKYGSAAVPELTEDGICGTTNTVITPEFAVRTGAAAAKISERGIAVSYADGAASESIAKAVMSGISSAGCIAYDCGNVPLPVLAYTAKLLGTDVMMHVMSRSQTKIPIYSAGLLPLKRVRERLFQGALARGEFMSAGWESFGEIREVTDAEMLYRAALAEASRFTVPYDVRVVSRNARFREICAPFARAVSNGKERLTVNIGERGDTAEMTCGDTFLDRVAVTLVACADNAENGTDTALPFAFPQTAEETARNYGGEVARYYASSMDDRDEEARRLATNQLYMRDGFMLALKVLSFLSRHAVTPAELSGLIAHSSAEERFIRLSCPPQRVLDRLGAVPEENEGAVIRGEGKRIFLRPDRRGTGLYMYAESFGTETAGSLCDRAEYLIRSAAMRGDKK
ncbi:MAG: NTP transferase domain-containing protein [Ruminiclostridium sp.]|nr:NTP transferase domain-containing protein [Ruminiclostridium sp.]